MELTTDDRSLLYTVLEDCATRTTPLADTLLESFESRLGLKHTVIFAGSDPASALASPQLSARGRLSKMAEPYRERYYPDDVFRTPHGIRRLTRRGVCSLHDLEPSLLDSHPAYVRDFHGGFGTRSLFVLNIEAGESACVIAAVGDFNGPLPEIAIRRLTAIRPILGAYFRTTDEDRRSDGPDLTARERQVVRLVLAGMSNAQIADACGLKTDSVKRYLTTIYETYGVKNRTQLSLVARRF